MLFLDHLFGRMFCIKPCHVQLYRAEKNTNDESHGLEELNFPNWIPTKKQNSSV